MVIDIYLFVVCTCEYANVYASTHRAVHMHMCALRIAARRQSQMSFLICHPPLFETVSYCPGTK